MSEKEFKSYKRIHDYDNPSEVEKGKIKRETGNYLKYRKKSAEKSKEVLSKIATADDYDEADEEIIEEIEHISVKQRRNASTHKKRYRKFEGYDDFH